MNGTAGLAFAGPAAMSRVRGRRGLEDHQERPGVRTLRRVFYFFQRGPDFVRCEISGEEASGYQIVVTQPDGKERTETFTSSDAAHARFLAIQEQLKSEGWWGPHGRE